MRSFLEFEHRHQGVLVWHRFMLRFGRNLALACTIIAAALGSGMAGYVHFEGLATIDAFLNAAMILSGMGPVATMTTSGGKVFAGCYALASGLILVVATGLVLAPVLHRILHHFHCTPPE